MIRAFGTYVGKKPNLNHHLDALNLAFLFLKTNTFRILSRHFDATFSLLNENQNNDEKILNW